MKPTSELVIAVDGGQSSTLALVATTDGRILATGRAGPSNHIHEPGGPERLRNAVTISSRQALEAAGQNAAQVVSICCGMTGGADLAAVVAGELFPAAKVQAYYDYVTALAGASLAEPGIVVIAGTGAVAYGRLVDGREALAGGWGYVMGDEGSGYDIGRSALQAASQAADGRAEMTTLLELIPRQVGVSDLRAVHQAVYSGALSRPQIARLTVAVVTAAQAGDGTAQRLLQTAGRHLAQSAVAVARRLDATENGMDVYPTGGVFQSAHAVNAAFRQALQEQSPALKVREAAFPPVAGSLCLALRAANVILSSKVINMLKDSFPIQAASKPPVDDSGIS